MAGQGTAAQDGGGGTIGVSVVGVKCDECGKTTWYSIDFGIRPLTRTEVEDWRKAEAVR